MAFECEYPGCNRSYQRKEHLTRHQQDHSSGQNFPCPSCLSSFSRSDTLRRHMSTHRAAGASLRATQACIPCSKAKTKCDGQKPSCCRCRDKDAACQWPQPRDQFVEASQPATEDRPPTLPRFDTSNSAQFVQVFFEKVHPEWPLLHQESFISKPQDAVLFQTVATLGLWASNASSDCRQTATAAHVQLVQTTETELPTLIQQANEGVLALSPVLLPSLQAMFLQAVMSLQLDEHRIISAGEISGMLHHLLQRIGGFQQSKIEAGAQKDWFLGELYQRLALLTVTLAVQCSLRANEEPCLPRYVNPLTLQIRIPLPLVMWNRTSLELVSNSASIMSQTMPEGDTLLISRICKTLRSGDNAIMPLFALRSFNQTLYKAVVHWCQNQDSQMQE